MSGHEVLAAVQACMMYLIMCIIDHSPENEGHGEALLRVLYASQIHMLSILWANSLQDLCVKFKGQNGGSLNASEISSPSSCWEDWIFAESRRRYVYQYFCREIPNYWL